jgi:pimeloyl-ACP methyl ester carboxylesterase
MKAGDSFRRIRQVRYPSLEAAIESFRPFPTPHHIAPGDLRHIATQSFKPTENGGFTTKFDWQVFRRNHSNVENPLADFPDQLAALDVPVLSLRGEESTILTAADQQELVARLRHGSGVLIPRATHNLHAEAPDDVARAIDAFLSSP